MAETVTLTVNEAEHSVPAEPDRPLLSVLRDELDLTGTHYGCGEGQCGACTVHINGVATRSCLLLLSAVAGRAVTTIEGLEQEGELHPVQEAFLDQEAFQCGYCTSGMIMSASSLLRRNASPSEEQVLQGMQGNICRCGMYRRIIAAVRSAAARQRTPA